MRKNKNSTETEANRQSFFLFRRCIELVGTQQGSINEK